MVRVGLIRFEYLVRARLPIEIDLDVMEFLGAMEFLSGASYDRRCQEAC